MQHDVTRCGFTLFEILIALFIFAILGTIAAIGLHSVLKTHGLIEKRDLQLQRLEIALTVMRRDFTQIIDRSIIDSDGHRKPAILSQELNAVEFTRIGFVNPMQMSRRSEMQRVRYRLDGEKLVRETWPMLNQAPNVQPSRSVLLDGVNDMQIHYVADNGERSIIWPLAEGSNIQVATQKSNLPKVIIIDVKIRFFGQMEMVFPVIARGFLGALSAK